MRSLLVAAIVAAVALSASTAMAQGYPLGLTSSRASFELIDLLRNDTFIVQHLYDATNARVRYAVRSPGGSLRTRTTVAALANWSRYSFDGFYNDVCDVEGAPALGTSDLAIALGVAMSTGAASISASVSPSVVAAGSVNVRGISSRRWVAQSVLVNVGAVHCSGALEWLVASDWSVSRVGGTLVHFTFDGTCGEGRAWPMLLHGNVFWMVPSSASTDLFRPLGTCNASAPLPTGLAPSVTDAPTPAPVETAFPMPTLPAQFSAQIVTTLVERRLAFNLYETFSWGKQAARATVVYAEGARTAIVDGNSGLAYTQTGAVGFTAMQDGPVAADGRMQTRALFDAVTKCTKEVYNFRLVGTVNDLLLRSTAAGPKYMGRIFARDVPAKYWRVTSGTYRITWFFEDLNAPAVTTPAPPTSQAAGGSPPATPPPATTVGTTAPPATTARPNTSAPIAANTSTQRRHFVSASASASNVGRLLRVTVSGTGTTPFFTVHPFLQRGVVTPESALEACREFLPEAPDACTDASSYFHHVYDFASFVEVIDEAELSPPAACSTEGGTTIAAYPAADNCPEELSPSSIFLMMLFSAVFAGILSGAAVYLRMTGKQKEASRGQDLNLS